MPQGNHAAARRFLWRLILESSDGTVARDACQLLALVVACQARYPIRIPAPEIVRREAADEAAAHAAQGRFWRQLLADEVAARLGELRQLALLLPAAGAAAEEAQEGAAVEPAPQAPGPGPLQWWAPPAALAPQPGVEVELAPAAQHCERILHYLAQLTETCQVSSAAAAAVKGVAVCPTAPLARPTPPMWARQRHPAPACHEC